MRTLDGEREEGVGDMFRSAHHCLVRRWNPRLWMPRCSERSIDPSHTAHDDGDDLFR